MVEGVRGWAERHVSPRVLHRGRGTAPRCEVEEGEGEGEGKGQNAVGAMTFGGCITV